MKNSIRILMTLSIVLLLSCGKEDSGSTANTGNSIDQDFQVRDVVFEKSGENRLRTRWTKPVKADRVNYYLVKLRSANVVITRRVSAGATELELAVPARSYRTGVAVVAEGIAESEVPGDKELIVETEATVPGDVGMSATDLSSVMTSAEDASITVKWRAPTEFGKIHGVLLQSQHRISSTGRREQQ